MGGRPPRIWATGGGERAGGRFPTSRLTPAVRLACHRGHPHVERFSLELSCGGTYDPFFGQHLFQFKRLARNTPRSPAYPPHNTETHYHPHPLSQPPLPP